MITYSGEDNIYYGTSADRNADTVIVTKPTAKFFEYDTGILYVSDGTQWYAT